MVDTCSAVAVVRTVATHAIRAQRAPYLLGVAKGAHKRWMVTFGAQLFQAGGTLYGCSGVPTVRAHDVVLAADDISKHQLASMVQPIEGYGSLTFVHGKLQHQLQDVRRRLH